MSIRCLPPLVAVVVALAACARPHSPAASDAAAAPLPPPPAPPPVSDAALDAHDAASDVADGPPRPAARRRPAAPAPSGGAGGGVAALAVSGNLPKDEAAKLLRGKLGVIRGCYDREHAKNPALHGKVTFRLTVDDRGRVTLGEVVTSTLGGGDPEMCMVQATRAFKFPPPPGGGDSTVTFQATFGR